MPSSAPRGATFEVRLGPRRPGDPAVVIAATERIRKLLGWVPQHDRLDAIVFQALRWEERLSGGVTCRKRAHNRLDEMGPQALGQRRQKGRRVCRQLGKHCVSRTSLLSKSTDVGICLVCADAPARLRDLAR